MNPDWLQAWEPCGPEIRQLLEASGLEAGDLLGTEEFRTLRAQGQLLGCGALVTWETGVGYLRSLAVAPQVRGQGLGRSLTLELLDRGRAQGVKRVYLLTSTAREFFLTLGFSPFPRDQAPREIQATEQFKSLCPQSAAFLSLDL